MEHYLNVTFIIGILTKSLSMHLILTENQDIQEKIDPLVHSAVSDINEESDKLKKKEKKKTKQKTKKKQKNNKLNVRTVVRKKFLT